MSRDLNKYIEEYMKKFEDTGSSKGAFYAQDITQIYERNRDKKDAAFYMISDALEAGFMVGYKYAKREANKK